jgi:DNA-binding response OmpR family regulator
LAAGKPSAQFSEVTMEPVFMNQELRVLMLEDTLTDAELEVRELRKAGISFSSLRVETREAFILALEEFRPDIIISDYNLPNFSGLAALEIVRNSHSEIPVIMVTGALTDVEAVEVLQAGAKDYVLKDRLARLGAAVQHVLSMEQGIRARKVAEKGLARERSEISCVGGSHQRLDMGSSTNRGFTLSPVRRYMTCWVIPPRRVVGKTPFDHDVAG